MRLLLVAYQTSAHVVLLGDFNEGAAGEVGDVLRAGGFEDSCSVSEAHCGGTFRGVDVTAPALVRIDHVFVKHVTPLGTAVLRGGGSDHLPVTAVLSR